MTGNRKMMVIMYLLMAPPMAVLNYMASALLAIDLGLMGPNYSISTACVTSNYCFYAAANHIRRGEADVMVAGGTEAPVIPIGLAIL
ncbi:3-oxoacyl-[acyl-carrier-protein] synthase I, chloroplastic-like [Silene latifolia]|uniref:3-oxoacyl-[acyl-carrier-protein] synthase I, chloroplastic-like n=1 Tax=Silene latifolia TaxID=37657 RepID=UPI003D78A885